MTLTQEGNISCSSWFRETLNTHLPPSWSRAKDTQSVCSIWCYAAEEGYTENIHTGLNSIMTFFSTIQFSPLLNNFSSLMRTEGCHITVCFLFLARGIKQISSSHSLDHLKTSPCFFYSGPQPFSSPRVFSSWQLVSLIKHTKKPQKPQTYKKPIPQHSGLLTHWTNRDWNLLDCWGGKNQRGFSMSQSQIRPKGNSQSSEDFYSAVRLGRECREYWMKTAGYQENTESYGSNAYRKLQKPSGFNRLTSHQNLGKYFSESAPFI